MSQLMPSYHRLITIQWLQFYYGNLFLPSFRNLIWMKSLLQITTYGENGHRLAVLLASDFALSEIILKKYPHVSDMVTSISLDHSIHFHTNHIDFNQWHLFDLECTFSGLDSITLNVSK